MADIVEQAAIEGAARFLCECDDWAGEHVPAGAGPCGRCDCEAFAPAAAEAVEAAARIPTRLGDAAIRLPAPATWRVEFTRPLEHNRGAAVFHGVEGFAVIGPLVFLIVAGEVEAGIPIDRIAFVGKVEASE